MSRLSSSENSDSLHFQENVSLVSNGDVSADNKPKVNSFQIQMSEIKSGTISKSVFFERNFMAYNLALLFFSSISLMVGGFGIIFLYETTPDEDNIYTISFTILMFGNFILSIVSIQNNSKHRNYHVHSWILRIMWVLLILGTGINVELLDNFPLSLHRYFPVCVLLILLYMTLSVFILARGQKLLKKMTGFEYLNR